MADLADLTSENDFNEEILRRHRKSRTAQVTQRGKCLNCNADVEHLFCDADCKEDYEYQQAVAGKTRK